MIRSIENFLSFIVDFILPPRSNFAIVKKLDEEAINNLPRAVGVENTAPRTELRSGTGVDWIHPLFHYKDNRVRAVVWELKYRENTLVLEYVARLLYDEIIALVSDVVLFDRDAQFLLIPIPITKQRRIERGYNQSELIARAIVECDTNHDLLYAPQWFSKIKETPSQSHSESKQERIRNLVGCFKADERVAGKYIILIDDVVTTGSTLSEAKNTLVQSGIRDVFAFTIAH